MESIIALLCGLVMGLIIMNWANYKFAKLNQRITSLELWADLPPAIRGRLAMEPPKEGKK